MECTNGTNLNEEVKPVTLTVEKILKLRLAMVELDNIRNDLYDKLPTGDIGAFELIKLIKAHINKLDKFDEKLCKLIP